MQDDTAASASPETLMDGAAQLQSVTPNGELFTNRFARNVRFSDVE